MTVAGEFASHHSKHAKVAFGEVRPNRNLATRKSLTVIVCRPLQIADGPKMTPAGFCESGNGIPRRLTSKLRWRPSRVRAYRRRKRRILDEVAHLDFIRCAWPSAPRAAQAALVVEYLGVRDECDLVWRQPADVAADAVHMQAVSQSHHAAGGHGAVAEVG
jgi:hypothetical protein